MLYKINEYENEMDIMVVIVRMELNRDRHKRDVNSNDEKMKQISSKLHIVDDKTT